MGGISYPQICYFHTFISKSSCPHIFIFLIFMSTEPVNITWRYRFNRTFSHLDMLEISISHIAEAQRRWEGNMNNYQHSERLLLGSKIVESHKVRSCWMPNLLAKFWCAAINIIGSGNATRGLQKRGTMKKFKRCLKVNTSALLIGHNILRKFTVSVKPHQTLTTATFCHKHMPNLKTISHVF